MGLFLNLWREYSWRGQDLIEMLELLPGFMLIRIRNTLSVDLSYVWEPIDDESSKQNSV